MSEAKHTPGKWMVSDASIVSEKYCIAVVEDDGGYEAPEEQRIANRALIAAAPELLEALEFMFEVGSEYYDMDMGENGSAALAKARAAIQKATTI